MNFRQIEELDLRSAENPYRAVSYDDLKDTYIKANNSIPQMRLISKNESIIINNINSIINECIQSNNRYCLAYIDLADMGRKKIFDADIFVEITRQMLYHSRELGLSVEDLTANFTNENIGTEFIKQLEKILEAGGKPLLVLIHIQWMPVCFEKHEIALGLRTNRYAALWSGNAKLENTEKVIFGYNELLIGSSHLYDSVGLEYYNQNDCYEDIQEAVDNTEQ